MHYHTIKIEILARIMWFSLLYWNRSLFSVQWILLLPKKWLFRVIHVLFWAMKKITLYQAASFWINDLMKRFLNQCLWPFKKRFLKTILEDWKSRNLLALWACFSGYWVLAHKIIVVFSSTLRWKNIYKSAWSIAEYIYVFSLGPIVSAYQCFRNVFNASFGRVFFLCVMQSAFAHLC